MHRRLQRTVTLVFSLLRSCSAQICGNCQSFGVDFISNGTYFQNSLSMDPFTALQSFEGCTNDTSHNVLVDPHGKQYECSMTAMNPDDTPQQVTCPINKNQMDSGKWSLLILSNNGDCSPIDYERDYYLSVGPQQTITVPPTIYITSTVTPIDNEAITFIETLTSTAPPSTTTVPRVTLHPTVTIRPLPSITKVTKAIFTITKLKLSASIVATTTKTSNARCHVPHRRTTPDPVATFAATVLSSVTSLLEGSTLAVRDAAPTLMLEYALDRRGLVKRAPDQPTFTFTETSASPVVSTITGTAPTQTIYISSTTYMTTTSTPVVIVGRGAEVSVVTITAPQRILTKTIWTAATTTQTPVQDVTLTITSTITPNQAASRCSKVGGTMS